MTFQHIMEQFSQQSKLLEQPTPRTVTSSEYQTWREHFTWHALQGKRIGQSFCEHFDVTDFRIYYDLNVDRCLSMIERDYVTDTPSHNLSYHS
jgi:hypothetical protein